MSQFSCHNTLVWCLLNSASLPISICKYLIWPRLRFQKCQSSISCTCQKLLTEERNPFVSFPQFARFYDSSLPKTFYTFACCYRDLEACFNTNANLVPTCLLSSRLTSMTSSTLCSFASKYYSII